MTRDNILVYITEPEKLNRETLPEVESLLSAYPYFQTGHLLNVKNHHNINSLRFNESLKSASIHIGDREILYHLIHDLISDKKSKTGEIDITHLAGKENLSITEEIRDQKTSLMEEKKHEEFSGQHPSAHEEELISAEGVHPYTLNGELVHTDQDIINDNNKSPHDEKHKKESELIEAFIKNKPVINPRKTVLEEQEDISESYIQHDDQLMTETLANIYISQGYYTKAIHVLDRLSLKYPEKSSYFATQINKLKKLLDNPKI